MKSGHQRGLLFLALVSYLLTLSSPAGDFSVRLAGYGSTKCSGRVEIYVNNSWGTVCDDGWDMNDARVVCRQLGCGTATKAPKSARFGPGAGAVWLDDVACSGSEASLSNCQHRKFGQHDCAHSEDAGVICNSIRLGDSTRCSGRVEIYHNNSWGTVCDDSWDTKDAEVVCRQLNCGAVLGAPRSALFGGGRGKIWLDDVACTGSEVSLTMCGHRGFGTHDCHHSEDASVICSASLPKPSITVSPALQVPWGERVTITCSNSAELSGGTFILKTQGSLRETERSSATSGVFSIPKMDFDDEGLYGCQYKKNISEKTFSSSPSDSVRLSVTVTFPKPSISMNPVGKVTWGEDVSITCSISTQNLGGTFFLLQTSGSFSETQSLSTGSTNFSIPNVGFADGGSYHCLYEKMGFRSEPSDSVRLSVAVPLPLLVLSIAAGTMLLLLLLVLLVICVVCRRKRRKAKRQGAPIFSQLTDTIRCEDDEDRHYMNLLVRDNNKGLKEETGNAEEEDSGDYERLRCDEVQHYDDVGLGKHSGTANEVCVNVEGNKDKEEVDDDAVEETNDDENGYLALTGSFDQT